MRYLVNKSAQHLIYPQNQNKKKHQVHQLQCSYADLIPTILQVKLWCKHCFSVRKLPKGLLKLLTEPRLVLYLCRLYHFKIKQRSGGFIQLTKLWRWF